MQSQSSLNPIELTIVLLTLAVSPSAAAVIGPYAVILLASTAGASWSVGRRAPTTRGGVAWYFLKINLTAFIVSAGAAVLAERWLGPETRQWTVAPIALVIGAVGDGWPSIGNKILAILLRALGKRLAGDQEPHP